MYYAQDKQLQQKNKIEILHTQQLQSIFIKIKLLCIKKIGLVFIGLLDFYFFLVLFLCVHDLFVYFFSNSFVDLFYFSAWFDHFFVSSLFTAVVTVGNQHGTFLPTNHPLLPLRVQPQVLLQQIPKLDPTATLILLI